MRLSVKLAALASVMLVAGTVWASGYPCPLCIPVIGKLLALA